MKLLWLLYWFVFLKICKTKQSSNYTKLIVQPIKTKARQFSCKKLLDSQAAKHHPSLGCLSELPNLDPLITGRSLSARPPVWTWTPPSRRATRSSPRGLSLTMPIPTPWTQTSAGWSTSRPQQPCAWTPQVLMILGTRYLGVYNPSSIICSELRTLLSTLTRMANPYAKYMENKLDSKYTFNELTRILFSLVQTQLCFSLNQPKRNTIIGFRPPPPTTANF